MDNQKHYQIKTQKVIFIGYPYNVSWLEQKVFVLISEKKIN